MNRSETARLLTAIAAFNNRTIGEADVIAWQSVLGDIELADGEEAVRRHYAESTDWILPAHVRRLVGEIVKAREVSPWAPGQYGVPRDEAMPEITTRIEQGDLTEDVLTLVTTIRTMLPEGSREALFPRRVGWEREHRAHLRTHGGEPNPLYKPRPECSSLCRPETPCGSVTHWWVGPAPVPAHAGECETCGCESGDLAQHRRDYPDGSCR